MAGGDSVEDGSDPSVVVALTALIAHVPQSSTRKVRNQSGIAPNSPAHPLSGCRSGGQEAGRKLAVIVRSMVWLDAH
ncbi:hypothetical protein GCM10022235_16330 [Kribbella ginsengisoli]|uniref:Uncharacterized protein n=1 Tax=Kribbella ginsengisoli TaxID=363865 RepID=A0ABP6WCG4_9ACTN